MAADWYIIEGSENVGIRGSKSAALEAIADFVDAERVVLSSRKSEAFPGCYLVEYARGTGAERTFVIGRPGAIEAAGFEILSMDRAPA